MASWCKCGECKNKIFSEPYQLAQHISDCHGINVFVTRTDESLPHWGYCNDCPKTNGHGRRMGNFRQLKEHLEGSHNISIKELIDGYDDDDDDHDEYGL